MSAFSVWWVPCTGQRADVSHAAACSYCHLRAWGTSRGMFLSRGSRKVNDEHLHPLLLLAFPPWRDAFINYFWTLSSKLQQYVACIFIHLTFPRFKKPMIA